MPSDPHPDATDTRHAAMLTETPAIASEHLDAEEIDPQAWLPTLEALLLASEQPLSIEQLQRLLADPEAPDRRSLRAALAALGASLEARAVELVEVASGWRLQIRPRHARMVQRLWQEKPPRLSRAMLETLAVICYQQPVTRGEVEDIRGVALSPNIIRSLLERGWIREVGVKEVPGRPTLFGTTSQLLDDLGLRSLDQLPELPAIKDPAQLEAALARLGHGTALPLGVPEVDAGTAPETGAAPDDAAADPALDAGSGEERRP
jgi:segregation and condensation protein B